MVRIGAAGPHRAGRGISVYLSVYFDLADRQEATFMGQTRGSAPVYFVLAQVRFNPILSLEAYIDDIQELLRREYPDFQRQQTMTLVVAPGGPQGVTTPQKTSQTRYLFGNMDKTAGFILDAASLAFQTTDYQGFSAFSEALRRGLTAVHDKVGLSFSERAGIRYLNAVYPGAEETLGYYLIPEIQGLSEKLVGSLAHAFSETRGQNEAGHAVVARTLIHDGAVGFPPDLVNTQLKVAERFMELKGRHAILDIDAAVEQRLAFAVSGVTSQLDALHGTAKGMFQTLVTDQARQAWGLL